MSSRSLTRWQPLASEPAMWAGDVIARYSDHRALLDEADVDAVIVATPNSTHADILDDFWESDKHLLIEKPLATTVADCRRMMVAAERHAGVVHVGMEYRFMPPVARLVDEVHRGTVGRLRMLSIREHRFPFLPKVGGLEPLCPQYGRHAGREVLSLLRPHETDRPVRARHGICLRRAGRESPP